VSLLSWAVARAVKLDKPLTGKVRVERDLRVQISDGVDLLADRYAPDGGDGLPVVLVRTPYGRRATAFRLFGEIFAQRGYQVVVQSCRGTFGSGGKWLPFQTDREDGLATIAWLRRQPWFGGKVGMFGPSYTGFVQWAIAADCPEEIGALSLVAAASRPRDMIYAGGGFALRTNLAWTQLVGSQAKGLSDMRVMIGRARKLRRACERVPLGEADRAVLGDHFEFFQDLLRREHADAPLWKSMDFSDRVAAVEAPTFSVTGWYDIFLLGQLADYRRLREAGRQPQLVVGPWGHSPRELLGPALRGSLRHFDTHLRRLPSALTGSPVRIYVMGAGEWVDLPEWPPSARKARLHLHPGGRLSESAPVEGPPDRYRFDPRDPTPDPGGNSYPGHGSHDNRKLEARSDVLTYTTQPLPSDLDVAGVATVELFVRSSLKHTDFVARLCDVSPRGKSMNVCDGLIRLGTGSTEPAGTRRITIDLWPTAYRFKKGHRVRLQVCSCAHPRYARNLGSGEPVATATTFCVADQEVFHDPGRPSAVVIPVWSRGDASASSG
jgi:putative CocE/NonD family hydrolase